MGFCPRKITTLGLTGGSDRPGGFRTPGGVQNLNTSCLPCPVSSSQKHVVKLILESHYTLNNPLKATRSLIRSVKVEVCNAFQTDIVFFDTSNSHLGETDTPIQNLCIHSNSLKVELNAFQELFSKHTADGPPWLQGCEGDT